MYTNREQTFAYLNSIVTHTHTQSKNQNMEHVFPSNKNDPLFRCCSLRQEEHPIFLHFPSPFLDDISATQLLPQHNMFSDPNKPLNITTHDHELYKCSIGTEPTQEIKPKKMKRSSGKKDRHSKIHTAHGLRGRRMRLSIHIARKFFDLQDMLGFDKASKTLDWLFSKSKKAIKELTLTLPSEMRNNQGTCIGERGESILLESESGVNARKGSGVEAIIPHLELRKNPRMSRKSALNTNDPLARELREKARARARERTLEKKVMCKKENSRKCEGLESNPNTPNLDKQDLGFTSNPNNTNMDKLGFTPNPFSNNAEIVQNSLVSSCSAFGHLKSFVASSRLDLSTKSLNFLENHDTRNLRISPNSSMAPFMPIIEGQNPSCILVTATNMNIHSQQLQERSVQFP